MSIRNQRGDSSWSAGGPADRCHMEPGLRTRWRAAELRPTFARRSLGVDARVSPAVPTAAAPGWLCQSRVLQRPGGPPPPNQGCVRHDLRVRDSPANTALRRRVGMGVLRRLGGAGSYPVICCPSAVATGCELIGPHVRAASTRDPWHARIGAGERLPGQLLHPQNPQICGVSAGRRARRDSNPRPSA
jgi:hypothetical protein